MTGKPVDDETKKGLLDQLLKAEDETLLAWAKLTPAERSEMEARLPGITEAMHRTIH